MCCDLAFEKPCLWKSCSLYIAERKLRNSKWDSHQSPGGVRMLRAIQQKSSFEINQETQTASQQIFPGQSFCWFVIRNLGRLGYVSIPSLHPSNLFKYSCLQESYCISFMWHSACDDLGNPGSDTAEAW